MYNMMERKRTVLMPRNHKRRRMVENITLLDKNSILLGPPFLLTWNAAVVMQDVIICASGL